MRQQTTRLRTIVPFGFILMAIGFTVFGFGQQALSQPAHQETHVHVTLKDFSVDPDQTTTRTGWITFHAMNAGTMAHELVILRTDLNPENLPQIEKKDHNGTVTGHIVNEDHAGVEPIDEIEEFPANVLKVKKILLPPGRYVLFCNVPEHYTKGMYTSLLVEK